MRVLVVGRGPVAQVLATSVAPEHRVGLALRERTTEPLLVGTRRLRAAGLAKRFKQRRVDVVTVDDRTRSWDVVISTASPASTKVAQLLGRQSSAMIAAVTQVPSEVAMLRELAGGRPWGLVVPEFFAAGADPAWWWQPARFRFTAAGPAEASLRSLLAGTRNSPLASPLVSAATTMPVVAGLQVADFDLASARRSSKELAIAATQARNAVAAEYGGRGPRAIHPHAVRAALTVFPRVAPFDVQHYLRSHFGGHTAQTVRMLRDWVALGRQHGLPTDELEGLSHATEEAAE